MKYIIIELFANPYNIKCIYKKKRNLWTMALKNEEQKHILIKNITKKQMKRKIKQLIKLNDGMIN